MRGRFRWVLFIVALVVAAPTAVWASHQFVDVPDSHVFHDDIAWLADNGVTLGCNPPDNDRFCPDEEVTRGEMAAFMRRLAEGGVVDAGSMGGLTAEQLGGTHVGNAIFDEAIPGEVGKELFNVEIIAPRGGGALTMTADVAVTTDGGGGPFWTEIDDGSCDENREIPNNSQSGFWVGDKGTDSGTVTWSTPVTQGRHTVSVCLWSTEPGTVLTSSVAVSWSPRALSVNGSSALMAPADVAVAMREPLSQGDIDD